MSLALSTLLYEWRRYMAAVMALALPGSVLVDAGLPLPTLNPQQAMLIEIRCTHD